MVQKILSDKVMNERTNAYYSYYLGERNISVLPAYFHERRSLNNFHRDRVITFEQIAE